jgi:N-acetylglutamate synthase-like GNAT family acetyltransferase
MCLEDWSDEMKEAGDHKELWYNKMKDKGLGVKIAVTEDDKVVGMIQYVPLEYSTAEGDNLYFINCIWVHGYKEGVGNFQKKGIGKRLIKAAEEDVRSKGAKGLVAWGLSIPVFMRASWFKKQGYVKVDKQSISVLLWKPFSNDAIPPKMIRQKALLKI